MTGLHGAVPSAIAAGPSPLTAAQPAAAATRPDTGPEVQADRSDVVTISRTALLRQWMSGLVATVEHLAQAVQELDQATSRATDEPPTSLAPLLGRLAEAAHDVGISFATPSPASSFGSPGKDGLAPGRMTGGSDAGPAPGADMAASYARSAAIQPSIAPDGATPMPRTMPEVPFEAPDSRGRTVPGGHAPLPKASPSTEAAAAAPELATPQGSRRLAALDVALRSTSPVEIGAAAASAGDVARVLLRHASDALATTRLITECVFGPDAAGVAAMTAPGPQDLAATLAHAEYQVAMAALQLAEPSNSSAGMGGIQPGRLDRLGFALGSRIAGWGLGGVPHALSRARRALVLVPLCVAGGAVWVATTLDLSVARTVCAAALGLLGVAGVIHLLHRATRLRVSMAVPPEDGPFVPDPLGPEPGAVRRVATAGPSSCS